MDGCRQICALEETVAAASNEPRRILHVPVIGYGCVRFVERCLCFKVSGVYMCIHVV